MAENQWISVAYAADIVATSDARKPIQRAWKLGAIRLRGLRPGESEPVEIPFNEGGRVDCKKSRIVIGRLCRPHESVTMRWADVERLAQADFERELLKASSPASPPTEQAPQGASNADISDAEAGPLLRAVASELLRLFPKGRPALRNDECMERVKKEAVGTLGVFSLRTLERAKALAWPRPKRQRAPKAGKARQT